MVEYPRVLEELDDLGDQSQRLLVLLEACDEQDVEIEADVGLAPVRRAVGSHLGIGIGRPDAALLLHIDQQQGDATQLERNGVQLLAIGKHHHGLAATAGLVAEQASKMLVQLISKESESRVEHPDL